MVQSKVTWVVSTTVALLLIGAAGISGEEEAATNTKSAPLVTAVDDTTRGGGGGGQGYSQQYHYASQPQGWVSSGISVDLTSGIIIAVGAIVLLLAFAGIIYPLLSSKGSGSGWGWEGGDSGSTSSSYGGWSRRSYDVAGTAHKVLSAVDKLYEAYNKKH